MQKVVFTSAYAINDKEFETAKNAGLYGLLIKPFDLNNLNDIVVSKNNLILYLISVRHCISDKNIFLTL